MDYALGFVSVHVRDLARARPFYERVLGLALVQDGPPGETFYRFGPTLLCVHEDPEGACGRAPGGETGFYLQVEDVAAARAQVEAAGGRVAWEEERSFGLEDPDGNAFVVWAPRATWPPASGTL